MNILGPAPDSTAPRVLMLQNQIGVDGRSHVLAEIINVVNQLGIEPDIFTMATRTQSMAFLCAQGPRLRFRIRRLPFPSVRGYILQVVLSNALARLSSRSYDLVVNLNDNFYLLPHSPMYVHYISDPLAATIENVRTHGESVVRRSYAAVCEILFKWLRADIRGTIVANSEFTRRRLARQLGRDAPAIEVIFPPTVPRSRIVSGFARKEYDVVSVGAFSPEKGQLRQLELAERARDIRFAMIGTIPNQRYFRKCADRKIERGLDNVELLPNLPQAGLQSILSRAKVFLHYSANEGFGISTVEGMAHGCIAVVPNSGGQQEVVPVPDLRFGNDSEIITILRAVLSYPTETRAAMLAVLQAHIEEYTVEQFQEKIRSLLVRCFASTLAMAGNAR